MSEQDFETLLGGFAADTLTPEEQQALYHAALQDQQLFNVLADEQALKELLADPAVRQRLLSIVKQTSVSRMGEHVSWLEWFKRPAGLAVAGGLTAVMFAVLLGTRIFQDSLNRAAPSVATDGAKPGAPPIISQPKTNENASPAGEMPKNEALDNTIARPERSVPSNKSGRPTADVPGSKNQNLASNSAAPPPDLAPMQTSGGAATNAIPLVSARALFYGGKPARQDERRPAASSESAPPTDQFEKKSDPSALAGKVRGTATELMPLGLRYSFVVRGTDGQDREVDAAQAAQNVTLARLTMEANQDAYLQVWKTVANSTPQLLLPDKDTGQISLKIAAGQRWNISLPTESGPITITARVSRFPFGPITRQEAAMFNRLSPNQVQESALAGGAGGEQEHATYIVNQNPSPAAELAVEIPLTR